MKINSARHQHEPKELKTERDCSHRRLFRPLWGSSIWRNNQRSGSDEKLSAHSDFNPDPELLTPTESRDSVGVSVIAHTYITYIREYPPRGVKNALQIMSLAFYASETNELGLHNRTRGSV